MSDTVFKQVGYDVNSLIKFVELGEIGLPDIQRPFVWSNAKVRDLFDSMYRGYPVGYLLFWQNSLTEPARAIGTDQKQKPPRLLIVDGQQRLTSLYAVIQNVPVVREDYSTERIRIAFNPLNGRFAVSDAAIERDPSFIYDISGLWSPDTDIFEIVETYVSRLGSSRTLSTEDMKAARQAILKLQALQSFPFTALELSPSVNEEEVAEVFVRINSQGKSLNQADFILTLMSVFWDEGRTQLEEFCRDSRVPVKSGPSPYNAFIEPSPDQLLRVSVALGFKRARLRSVYSILRGKDLDTEEFSEELRDKQFQVLMDAQARTLDLNHWHGYLACVREAGYLSSKMISSGNNLLFSYILYLIGKTEHNIPERELRRAIAQWFFMSSLTGRYTGSPETRMDFELAQLREATNGPEFLGYLKQVCQQTLTEDFWDITLPGGLATSASISPALFAYYASLVLLDAPVLFSNQRVADLLAPAGQGGRSPIERHHLFPRAHLATLGIAGTRETNQIANYALLEWSDNMNASGRPPAEYLPEFRPHFDTKIFSDMARLHALPTGWESMSYRDFLERRRELIAGIIREGYQRLSHDGAQPTEKRPVAELIGSGEADDVEFKSTLRTNLHTAKPDERMELSALKTIAAFVNARGGTLLIGVSDEGEAQGLEADGFANEDKMALHLVNLVRGRMGAGCLTEVHPRFEDYRDSRVLVVDCTPASTPVFVSDGKEKRFYVRTGPSTTELAGAEMQAFIASRY